MTDATRPRAARMDPAERRIQLLGVAEQLFIAHGFAGVTMEDIARAAGVTRPVVYDHFGTREGAYLAVVRQARAVFAQRLLGSADVQAPIIDRLRAGGDTFFAWLEDDPGRWRLLFASNSVLPGDANRELEGLRFETIKQIQALLSPGMDTDLSPDRVEARAHAISGAGERLGFWWLANPQIPRTEVVEHFVDIVWAGISPRV